MSQVVPERGRLSIGSLFWVTAATLAGRIQSDSVIVLRAGAGTGLTLFGHDDNFATWLSLADTPNEDRGEQ